MCKQSFKCKPDVNPAVVHPFQSQGLRSRDLHSPVCPAPLLNTETQAAVFLSTNTALHSEGESLHYPKTLKLKISLTDFNAICLGLPLQEGEIASGDYSFEKQNILFNWK